MEDTREESWLGCEPSVMASGDEPQPAEVSPHCVGLHLPFERSYRQDDDGGDYEVKGNEAIVLVGSGETADPGVKKNLVDVEMGEVDCESSLGLDRGYAWLVVLGAFCSWVISAGFAKSGGIFFLQFKNHFNTGALQAAWPGSVFSLLQNLSGPVVSVVCSRYSVRTSVMIGGALTLIGLILNFLANDFYFLFFCHSMLQGVGLGFVLTPGLYIVTSYFDKRRGFAISLASAGGGVGAFVIVPLITFLFNFYGFHGCFLVLAGLMCNAFVVAMLYRPFRAHQQYLLAQSRFKKQGLCSLECNGEQAMTPLQKNATTITTSDISTSALSPPKGKMTSHHCPPLKSCFKICFPTEHKKTTRGKLFHFELLKDFSFLLYMLSTFLFTMALKACYTFIPAACVDKGLSQTDAALVVSIAGAVDTIGRILTGLVLDTPRLKPHRGSIYVVFLFFMALCVVFVPFLSSFLAFVLVCSLMGTFFGAHVSQRAVVIVDLMGKSMLPSCMGLVRLCQAFAMMAGPLLFGAIRDATGSYKVAFFVGCGLLMSAAVVLVASIVVFHWQKRCTERQQQQKQQQQQQH